MVYGVEFYQAVVLHWRQTPDANLTHYFPKISMPK